MDFTIRSPFLIKKKDVNGTGSLAKLASGKNFIYLSDSGYSVSNDCKTVEGQLYAYKYCGPVAAIIQRIAKASANAKVYIEDKNGQEATGMDIKFIQSILKQPNPLQSWESFKEQLDQYFYTFGEVFIYPLKSIGFKDLQLFLIPNWIIKPFYKTGIASQWFRENPVLYWQIDTKTEILKLQPDELWHYKNSVPNDLDPIRGRSLLYSLDSTINNILTAMEARRTLMENTGPKGILNSASTGINAFPVTPEEGDRIQDNLNGYGLSRDKKQVIISKASLQWTAMGFSTRDLLLFEEIEDDVRQLCDSLGYPMYLLGFKNNSTYNNVSEAEKGLYQNNVIPYNNSFYSWLTGKLRMGTNYICAEFDHVQALQTSEKEKADTAKAISDAVISVITSPGLSDEQKINILYTYYDYDLQEATDLINIGIKSKTNENGTQGTANQI